MNFWDSSAVAPLLVRQAHSDEVVRLYRSRPALAVWWGCRVECESAIARLIRRGELTPHHGDDARQALARLANEWMEVKPSEEVRSLAIRLLRVHDLRTADALQLAAALVVLPRGEGGFVCLDRKLQHSARLEGFRPPPAMTP